MIRKGAAMSRRPLKTTVLVLLALFLSFPAFATPRHTPKSKGSQTASFRRQAAALWNYLAAMLKNGSGIDPFGKPVPADPPGATPQGSGDNGSGIDPLGGK
jgi:hypothetical protein